MGSRLRKATTVAAALSAALVAGCALAVPAHADSLHPDIISFTAARTTGSTVTYSGQYASWNDADQAYEANDNPAVVEQGLAVYVPKSKAAHIAKSGWEGAGDVTVDSSGQFSGTLKLPAATELRFQVYDANGVYAASDSVRLPYYGPMHVDLEIVKAWQLKKGKPTHVVGAVFAEAGGGADTGLVLVPLTAPVHLQSKVHGKWITVRSFHEYYEATQQPAVVVKHPRSTLYRLFVAGSHKYKKAHSPTFKSAINNPADE